MGSNLQSPATLNGKPKLLDRVRNEIRVRHMARSTEKAYVNWIRRFILFHGKRHPAEMGKDEVTAFLTHLAVVGDVTASTQNQAFSALLFLYREVLKEEFGWLNDVVRARRGKRLPVVFSSREAMAIIEQLKRRRWLMGVLIGALPVFHAGCHAFRHSFAAHVLRLNGFAVQSPVDRYWSAALRQRSEAEARSARQA
jgi:site-specific recombinase XerD